MFADELTLWRWRLLIRDSRLSSSARLVALALSLRMDTDTLEAWPSVERLERETALSRRSVQRALSELRRLGYLDMKYQRGDAGGDRGRTNLYRARRPPWLDD